MLSSHWIAAVLLAFNIQIVASHLPLIARYINLLISTGKFNSTRASAMEQSKVFKHASFVWKSHAAWHAIIHIAQHIILWLIHVLCILFTVDFLVLLRKRK